MLIRMARAALRTERSVLTVLGALLLLAALLACTGAALMARLSGAGEDLLDRARAPDLVQMHAGELDEQEIDRFAESRPEVTAHRVAPLLGIDGAELQLAGENQAGSVQEISLAVPDPERDRMLVAEDDRPLTQVEPGTVWLPVFHRIEQGVTEGSTLVITAPDGYRLELTVAGFVRDSTMNTPIAGSKRWAVGPQDLAAVAAHTGTVEHLISFWVEDPATDIAALRTAYQEQGLPSAGPLVDRSAFALFTVIAEGLVASVVLLAAALVLVIALLCLRLALRTALERDRRELAVMSVIGIAARDQRRVHLLVHGAVALVASALGLLGGLVLEPQLSAGLTAYVGELGGPRTVLVPAAVAALLIAAVCASVELLLRRVQRTGPLAVLRGAGGTGTRPGRLRLHRSPLPVGTSLGIMALLRRGGGTVLLTSMFAISTMLVMLPSAVSTTLSSPQFSSYLGVGAEQLRLDISHAGDADEQRFAQAQRVLAEDPRVRAHSARTATRQLVTAADGTRLALPVVSGDHDDAPGRHVEGRSPRAPDEVALSLLAADEAGVGVGDRLAVEVGGQEHSLEVVGTYQDLTYGGLTAEGELSPAGEQVLWYVLSATPAPGEDPDALAAELAAALPGVRVSDADDHREQLLGPLAERIRTAAGGAILAALALAVLLSAMTSRLWLAAEAGPLAIRSALGASPASLRTPYLTRMLLSLGAGALLGAALTLTAGQGLLNLLLEGMFGGIQRLFSGTSRIPLLIDPLTTALALPLALVAAVTVTTLLVCRRIRTADVRTLTAD
jgi:putative ABC transport system permease protein